MAKHYFGLSKVLKKLLYDRRMNATKLAREVKLPVPTVHRLVSGKSTRPYPSSLQPIADFFSIEVDQLLGEKPLDESESLQQLSQYTVTPIPLYKWDTLCVQEPFTTDANNASEIPYLGKANKHVYATILPDASMEPMFSKNSILIVDYGKAVTDRCYVLVMLGNEKFAAFRQLLIDADKKYLKALNSDLQELQMRELGDKDIIIGILLESRVNFDT